jgi:hypothetical protein
MPSSHRQLAAKTTTFQHVNDLLALGGLVDLTEVELGQQTCPGIQTIDLTTPPRPQARTTPLQAPQGVATPPRALPGVTGSLRFPSAIIRPPRTPQRVAVGPRQLQLARASDRAPSDSRRAVERPVQSHHRVEPQRHQPDITVIHGPYRIPQVHENNVYDEQEEEDNNGGEWDEWNGFESDREGQDLPSSQGSPSQSDNGPLSYADLPGAVALDDDEDEVIPDIPSGAIGAFPTVQELQVAINEWARSRGFAVIRTKGRGKKKGQYTRYDIVCDRFGDPRASTSVPPPHRHLRPLNNCKTDCTISQQFGIPCRHKIYYNLVNSDPLKKWHVHHH